jgi:membrane protein DedA with SNARE-associated domain
MLERLIDWLLHALLDLGYPGIVALMAEMNVWIVLTCGVVGSILGALANYWVAHLLGRAFVRRFGRYVLLSERSLERSERFFASHGAISTLVGRLLPVIRHLISIPAGIARMPLPQFVTFTGLGAFAWCSVLTGIGYFLGRHEDVLRNEEVQRYVTRALMVVIPVVALGITVYVIRHRRREAARQKAQ